MRVALLGMPGSGKTTVFGAVAEEPVDAPPGSIQTETNIQVVKVKDPRLDRLRDIYQPKKFTPAGLEVWDAPGLVPGGGEREKEKRLKLLHTLREADAYVLVVRSFTSDRYPYERAEPNPAADLAFLVDEMLAADYVIAEARMRKLEENLKRNLRTKEEDKRELAVIQKCLERLEDGRSLRDLELDDADDKRIRGYQFFARKPLVVLVNGPDATAEGLGEDLALPFGARLGLDAQIEAELAAMDAADRPTFMEEFGIEEAAAERFVHEIYRAVGLISFFTVGEDEVRAWTLKDGQSAVEAAGKIHTDLARGFVRAEVYDWKELSDAGGERELKAKNLIRLEPKGYVVKDGEIVHIRSST
jgi:GTP-binding protein YchF